MFEITRKVDYGVRLLVALANQEPDARCTSRKLFDDLGIPMAFSQTILRDLVNANIVNAVRGSKGGFWMTRPPEEITILEIIEALQGPVNLTANLPERGSAWADLQQRIVAHITAMTLAEFAATIPQPN